MYLCSLWQWHCFRVATDRANHCGLSRQYWPTSSQPLIKEQVLLRINQVYWWRWPHKPCERCNYLQHSDTQHNDFSISTLSIDNQHNSIECRSALFTIDIETEIIYKSYWKWQVARFGFRVLKLYQIKRVECKSKSKYAELIKVESVLWEQIPVMDRCILDTNAGKQLS